MESKLTREDIDDLIKRVRILISAVTQDGIVIRSPALAARADGFMRDLYGSLGLGTSSYDAGVDDDGSAARICAYCAMTAAAVGVTQASLGGCEESGSACDMLIRQITDLFTSLASVALLLRDSADLSQLYLRPLAAQTSELSAGDELEQLFDATIRLYEQGHWTTAAKAARDITPLIVELAAELANRRAGTPLLRSGTSKPLEWIRRHRRAKA